MAAVEVHDPVGALGLFMQLRREDDGAAVGAERCDLLPQLGAPVVVERRGGLVEEEDARVAEEGEREVQALPLADRELAAGRSGRSMPTIGARASRANSSTFSRGVSLE